MRVEKLMSVGHNIADSLASGIGLMIGIYEMDVYAEAAAEEEGFLVVDFLAGRTSGREVSAGLREAVERYRDALRNLCSRHQVSLTDFRKLEARYGTDPVYGPHFTVTVENQQGRQLAMQYVGIPGRRLRRRR